jgi:hypothetical protein
VSGQLLKPLFAMKKKVHKLAGSEGITYVLLGISSHENDYRLSWAINRQLGLDFRRTESLRVPDKKNIDADPFEFSMFQYTSTDGIIKMNLISNRCPNGFFISKLKNIDFFLQIFGEDAVDMVDKLSKDLRSIDLVSTVFEVPWKNVNAKWSFPLE